MKIEKLKIESSTRNETGIINKINELIEAHNLSVKEGLSNMNIIAVDLVDATGKSIDIKSLIKK